MSALPLPVLPDMAMLDDLFKKKDCKKKLEEMLMDPRVIEMSRQSPQNRQVLAAIVRKLQEEREKKRKMKGSENKEEFPRWFDCILFKRAFSGSQKRVIFQHQDILGKVVKQRNKLTMSTPNLNLIQDIPVMEGPVDISGFDDKDKNLSLFLPNNDRNMVPGNIIEFCTSEKGKAMISTLLCNIDMTQLFGIKRQSSSKSIVKCMDSYNCSEMKTIQCYSVPTIFGQVIRIMCPIRTVNSTIWAQGSNSSMRSLVSSATQTLILGSCSTCSSKTDSCDSYSPNHDTTLVSTTDNAGYTRVVQVDKRLKINFNANLGNKCYRKPFVKTSKSQSAMYTTEYTECDCESVYDISGSKYLPKLLQDVKTPNLKYLTTPEEVVCYSGSNLCTESDTSNSCENCRKLRAPVSSESSNCEPSQIWTQKRRKTSCESCCSLFKRDIQLSEITYDKDYEDSSSDSNECKKTNHFLRPERRKEKDLNDPRILLQDVPLLSEKRFVVEKEQLGKGVGDKKNSNQFTGMPPTALHKEVTFIDKKPEITASEALLPQIDIRQYIPNHQSTSSNEYNDSNNTGTDYPPIHKTSIHHKDPLTSTLGTIYPLNPAGEHHNLSTSESIEENSLSSHSSVPHRNKKHRRRTRTKTGNVDTSSNSSTQRARIFPRRSKQVIGPNSHKPILDNCTNKVNKQKSRSKNCVIM